MLMGSSLNRSSGFITSTLSPDEARQRYARMTDAPERDDSVLIETSPRANRPQVSLHS
jgi:hypothetical protein